MTRNRAFALTSGYYTILFFSLGAYLPFWPIWLSDWGLSDSEIGHMLGVAVLARVLGATLVPALADRLAWRRVVLAISAGLSACIILGHLSAQSEAVLLMLTLAMALISAPLVPIGEALGLRASERYGFAYAHARAIGSLAFLAMVLALGPVIDLFGPGSILAVLVLSLLGAAVMGGFHPGGGAAPGIPDQSRWPDLHRLVCNQSFLLFAAASAFGQGAHAVYYTFSALHWSAAGFSTAEIGALWATGVAAEILLFFGPGRRWVASIGPARAFQIAALAGLVRWGAMTMAPDGWILWVLQAMHALTFGLTLLAAMAFVSAAIPPRLAASAQGLSAGLAGGLTMTGLTLTAGTFAGTLDPAGLYWIGVVAVIASAIASLLLGFKWTGRRLMI